MRIARALVLSIVFAFAAHGACPTVTFEPRMVHAPGGDNPFIGSTTDVNVDGRSDVSLYYNDSTGFQSYLANEDGTLTPGPLYPTSSIATLEIADIDGDGLPDAAAGSGFDVRLFEGNGDGTYLFRGDIPVGAAPTDIRVADLNEDGLRDVIVVMRITAQVVVLTQTAPWTFIAAPPIAMGGFEPTGPHVVDLNGDSNLDVIMVNFGNTVDILYGHGDGTFDPVVKITLPANPPEMLPARGVSLAVGDFNYDGRLDFAAGQIENGAAVYVNDGGRSFHFDRRVAGRETVTPGAGARDIELADVNADGLADLIISTYGGFYTLLARPAGFFDPPVFHEVPELQFFGGIDGMQFEVGDFRGDGRSDLAATIRGPSPTLLFVTYPNACVPPPTLTSLAPDFGPAEGGTVVTITGESLLTTTEVLFGSTPGTILDTTATSVTVQTPASTPSIVDVTVTTGGGSATLTGAFRFIGATTTTVTTEPALVVVGEPFQLVATIAPTLSGGTVTFTEGSTVLGNAPVVNGRASIALTSSTIVPRTITADFSGTPIHFPSSGSITFRAFLPIAMTLHTSAVPEVNRPYRVTAILDPAITGGTITFTVNGDVAGTVPVTNGSAFIDVVATELGPQEIVATFSGFGDYAPETAAISFQVGHAIPTLSELALFALAMMVAAVATMKLRS